MSLDLTSLKKAVSSLQKAMKVASSPESVRRLGDDEREVVKAGVIRNFEFTFELCWKFMRRWITANLGAARIDGITRRELFRLAVENRLISDFARWDEYYEARNLTSHTYDSDTADEIFRLAQEFSVDAKSLLTALEERND
ncbi:MAG: nucleotidyltransferase substrate binding protein [Candidatus Hydrogenedentes bacterium]|nr:nucleotidyltransferase substrate binding protein [Candidatus Hydrogenedentota bacterium]